MDTRRATVRRMQAAESTAEKVDLLLDEMNTLNEQVQQLRQMIEHLLNAQDADKKELER